MPDSARKDADMLAYFCQSCHEDCVLQVGLMPRVGINNLPFNNDFVQYIGQPMPNYDPGFNLSWQEITDRRAQQIQTLIQTQHKQIYVQWSGGIDSTCILVAMLKNFDRDTLSRVTVCYTYDSILEYSKFYLGHILPNFKTQDLNLVPLDLAGQPNALLIDGQTADTLTMSMAPSLDINMAVRNSDLLVKDWRTDPDTLILYLSRVTGSREFAQWYYDRIGENIKSVDVPIETYFDFMWWAGFNYDWAYQTFCQWFYLQRSNQLGFKEFSNKYLPWFCNDEYQLWSLTHVGAWVKHGRGVASFKQDAKHYCYEYTHDEWNWRYKTKVSSRGRPYILDNTLPFAVTDDFRVLGLETDLNEISTLWPSHFKD